MSNVQEMKFCVTLNTVEEAIRNLELLSEVLEKHSIKKEIYNSDLGNYLEEISWEMHKLANDARALTSVCGWY
jgi:site-specific recombinase XerD